MKNGILFLLVFSLILIPLGATGREDRLISSEEHNFTLELLESSLNHPWSVAFLPGDMGIIVTEREGTLLRLEGDLRHTISGLPEIAAIGQGGLLDVAVDPLFLQNNIIYFSYSREGSEGYSTAVARAELRNNNLENIKILFLAAPESSGGRHFGSRLLITPRGDLFITLGERGIRDNAQKLDNHGGSLLRLNRDGSVPGDNPFLNTPGAKGEIYSYGHRNAQGLAMDSRGRIWLHEHGPKGGDELNLIIPGGNYGWPLLTHGRNYNGTIITERTSAPGMIDPVANWVPSIAPSGMSFYEGRLFPQWEGDLFIGALAGKHLRRLRIRENKVVHQEILLLNEIGRIRDVRTGPDGALYLLTDENNGALYRMTPPGGD